MLSQQGFHCVCYANVTASCPVVLQHYEAVMRYVSQGPMLMDVHMHKPNAISRNFMDALLAFWPGLQVLSLRVENLL